MCLEIEVFGDFVENKGHFDPFSIFDLITFSIFHNIIRKLHIIVEISFTNLIILI